MQSLKKIHAWAQMKVPLFARALFSRNFAYAKLAVYHKRGNHTVTLYEKRAKIRYHLLG